MTEQTTPDRDRVVGYTTLQFAVGGLLDSRPTDRLAHLVRRTDRGTPGPTLCGIDRFAKGAPGWSVGGGVSDVTDPCPKCASAQWPDLWRLAWPASSARPEARRCGQLVRRQSSRPSKRSMRRRRLSRSPKRASSPAEAKQLSIEEHKRIHGTHAHDRFDCDGCQAVYADALARAQGAEVATLREVSPALTAAIRWVEECIAPKRCDSEAVSNCWRCTTVFLARTVQRALTSDTESGK